MKRINKLLISIMLIFLLVIHFENYTSFADVGDFATYDSGYSSGYSSSSDWGSESGYDYGGYDSSGGSIHLTQAQWIEIIVFLIIATIVAVIVYNIFKNMNNYAPIYNPQVHIHKTPEPLENEDSIVEKIKEKDPNFSREQLINWSQDLFVKLQYAWSDRDWSVIRCFETQELFEQHSTQLERYKINKQINKMERVSVSNGKLYSFRQEADKDILNIIVSAQMIDYIIDENTNQVLKGNPNEYKIRTYKMTFIRKTGVKTRIGENTVNTKTCPNCGAPTEITSAGKCQYCGSIITTGEYNWVLSSLVPYDGR